MGLEALFTFCDLCTGLWPQGLVLNMQPVRSFPCAGLLKTSFRLVRRRGVVASGAGLWHQCLAQTSTSLQLAASSGPCVGCSEAWLDASMPV